MPEPDTRDILLTTLNAKYMHAAFGLRYLMANLEPVGLAERAAICEFDISQRPIDIAERLLARSPRIVGIGVYIWNTRESTELAALLRRLRPDLIIVLGGPEVSHETEQQEIVRHADYVITGEADLAFADLCARLLAGRRPLQKLIAAAPPEFVAKAIKGQETPDLSIPSVTPSLDRFVACSPLRLPYHLYTDRDIDHRVIYVEASRGCPFRCEFCLSSLDVPVRAVPTDAFLAEMQKLFDRGLRQFKFVDRTFNLNLNVSKAILQFFLDRYEPSLFLHFEMIPDRLPEALRTLIARFPPGALQFEIGIQTFNEDVSALISRRQDNMKVAENLRWLRSETGVHIHADLIAGLPGEDLKSFAAGFDRLVELGPQEIQVGILKRLRGTPIARHDAEWQMVYSPHPPYEVLSTKLIDFANLQRIRRFARYWDTIANSGNFVETLPLLLGRDDEHASAFVRFMELSDRLHDRMGRNHGIALNDLAEFLFRHLTEQLGLPPDAVAQRLWQDHLRNGRSDRPTFLRPFVGDAPIPRRSTAAARALPRRQARHLGH
ncbi:MAG: DUF4080 domain-containing protein [Tepidisphaeraceae bacterium]